MLSEPLQLVICVLVGDKILVDINVGVGHRSGLVDVDVLVFRTVGGLLLLMLMGMLGGMLVVY